MSLPAPSDQIIDILSKCTCRTDQDSNTLYSTLSFLNFYRKFIMVTSQCCSPAERTGNYVVKSKSLSVGSLPKEQTFTQRMNV